MKQCDRDIAVRNITFFFLTLFTQGFWISMPPPCMDVLKDITHSNYEQISIPLAINMIGITVGSLVIGITVDKLEVSEFIDHH